MDRNVISRKMYMGSKDPEILESTQLIDFVQYKNVDDTP